MILVRYTFQAEFGKAGEVIEMFKAGAEQMRAAGGLSQVVRSRFLTDLSGDFDTVVQEMEFKSLTDWEQFRTAMFTSSAWEEQRESNPSPPFVSGSAQFFTIEWDSNTTS